MKWLNGLFVLLLLSMNMACASVSIQGLVIDAQTEKALQDVIARGEFAIPPFDLWTGGYKHLIETWQTDSAGYYSLLHIGQRCSCVTVKYTKDGYHSFMKVFRKQGRDDPQDYVCDVKLYPIVCPVDFKSRRYYGYPFPPSRRIGYDAQIGDWVGPRGKGKVEDFVFSIADYEEKIGPNKYSEGTWKRSRSVFMVEAPGAGNGLLKAGELDEQNQEFIFRAPTEGYLPKVGYPRGSLESPGGNTDNLPDVVFFRIRTEYNADGSIRSAYYGKIRGFLMAGYPYSFGFTYFLNPTPNDTNLEFLLGKNLFPPQE